MIIKNRHAINVYCDSELLAVAKQKCSNRGFHINQYITMIYHMMATKNIFPFYYKPEPTTFTHKRDTLRPRIPTEIYDKAAVLVNEHHVSHASIVRSTVYYIALHDELPYSIIEYKRSNNFDTKTGIF
jgi:hypothetical protein